MYWMDWREEKTPGIITASLLLLRFLHKIKDKNEQNKLHQSDEQNNCNTVFDERRCIYGCEIWTLIMSLELNSKFGNAETWKILTFRKKDLQHCQGFQWIKCPKLNDADVIIWHVSVMKKHTKKNRENDISTWERKRGLFAQISTKRKKINTNLRTDSQETLGLRKYLLQ